MQRFAFFIIHGLLFTIVKSHPLNEEIQSEPSKKELWSGDSAVECKLNYDRSSDDSNKIREDNQQTFNDWNNDRKQNFHKISEVEKDDSNSNEILFNKFEGEDDDSSQVLNEAKEKSLIDVHPSRYLRSITVNKNVIEVKEKSKKKKQKSKDKSNKKDMKYPVNDKLVTFSSDDLAKIVLGLKELQFSSILTKFKHLSDIINKAIDKAPNNIIPTVQALSTTYSATRKSIQKYLNKVCSILSKFVLKTYRIIKYGMSNDDKNMLKDFQERLSDDMTNNFSNVIESFRDKLLDIHKQLLAATHGQRLTNLLREKNILEIDLANKSLNLRNKKSEYNGNQDDIDLLKNEIQNSEAAKVEMEEKIRRLRDQIPDYEMKVLQSRNSPDNGEQVARENLNLLVQQIRTLERTVADWSNIGLYKSAANISIEMKIYQYRKNLLEYEYKQLNESYDRTKRNLDAVIRELEEIYRLAGTKDIESIQMVDELGRAVFGGQSSIIEGYALVQVYLTMINVDRDLLVGSVLAALKFMNVADSYMDTTRIERIKSILKIE